MISLALRQWPCPAMLAFHRPRRWLLVAALLAIAGCSEGAGRTVAVAAEPGADSQAGENELAQAPGKIGRAHV